MEIDHHHRIALARICLRVPAIAPAIAEAALRTAVDQERHGILLARLVVPRLDHVAMHGLAVPANEIELFVLAPGHVRQHLAGARGDRAQRSLAVGAAGVDDVAALHRIARDRQRRPGQVERGHAAVLDHAFHFAVRERDAEQRMPAEFLRGGVDPLAVGGQGDAVGGGIPLRCDLAGLAGGQVHRHQGKTIGLETGARHRAVVQGLAIGAEHRTGIPRRILRGEVARAAAIRVDQPEVEVGAPGFLAVGLAHAHRDLPAVRRPGEIGQVAERLGGDVAGDVAAQQRRVLDHAIAAQLRREHAVEATVVPGVPVADEHAVEHLAGGLQRFDLIQLLLRAIEVRLALREHRQRQRDLGAIRRQLVAVNVDRGVGEALRFATCERHRIQLHRPRLRAHEIDGLAIRRERRRIDVPAVRRQSRRRPHVACHQVAHPQRGAGLVGGLVDHALGEHQHASVRRQRR